MVEYATPKITDFRSGDHLGWFYETEAEYRQLLTPFLSQGLERGEKVLYLFDTHTPEAILSYLKKEGLEADAYLKRGQLHFLAADAVYRRAGFFEPQAMIDWLKAETDQAMTQGYITLRLTVEMSWATRGLSDSTPLLEYVSRLDQCSSGWPCLTLCQYNRRVFDPAWLLEIMTAHPLLIIGTEIFSNFYHIPRSQVHSSPLAAVSLANRIYSLIRAKRAEPKLRQSEERYRLLAENVSDVIWIYDLNLKSIYISPSITDLRGFSVEEAMAQPLEDIFPPASLKMVKQAVAEDLRLELQGHQELSRPHTLKVEQYRKDGSTVWTEIKASFLRDQAGQPVGFLGITRDISDRQQAEEALRQSERFLQNVFDAIQDGISVRDRHFTLTKVNRCLEKWSAAEMPLVGKKCYVAFAQRLSPCPWCPAIPALKTGQPHSQIVRHDFAENQPGWFELSAFPLRDDDGQIIGTIEYAKDITARHLAQEALRESEARFRQLLECAPDAIFLNDAGRIIEVNQQACDMLGYTRDELLNLTVADIDVGIMPEELGQRWQQRIKSPETFYDLLRRKDGSTLPIEIRVTPFEYQGRHLRLGIARDITERRQTELALKRREAVLEALSYTAQKFMEAYSWEQHIQEILAALGQTLEVSRAYIFENHRTPNGELLTSQRYEWVAPGITPQIDNPELQHFSWDKAGYGRWPQILSQGQPIFGLVRHLPPAEQKLCVAQDIKSVVVMPIFVEQEWWGVIGFDECRAERQWSGMEIEALRTAAATLGAAIEHERAHKALRESESNLRYLTAELISAQERERKRISSELHNQLGQSLMALKYCLRSMQRQLQPDQHFLQEEFDSLFEYIDKIIDDVRRLCRDLSPLILEELGLTAALRNLLNDFQIYYDIQDCRAQLEDLDDLFPPKWKPIIYRIIQELLTNIGKHAKPSRVSFATKKIDQKLQIELKDNGRGFNPVQVSSLETPQHGLGLMVMSERLKMLGGDLDIRSQANQGTEVTITIPIFREGG
ncbi:MAG: PAS domain S-box protein [Desulfobacteraceae bacterium]